MDSFGGTDTSEELMDGGQEWAIARKAVPWSGGFVGATAGLLVAGVQWATGWRTNEPTDAGMFALSVFAGLFFALVVRTRWKRLFGRAVPPDLLGEIERRFGLVLWVVAFGLMGRMFSRNPVATGFVAGITLDIARTSWFRSAARRVLAPIFGGTSGSSGGQQ